VGHVIWRPELPGSKILAVLGPLTFVSGLAVAMLMWVLAQSLARATEGLRAARDTAEAARAEAERASAAKSEFLASMSHEIRTPLNGIMGYTDILLHDPTLQGRHRHGLERIRVSGSALLTVVNDVLDFSKVEAGQVELHPEPFSPAALIDNAVSIVQSEADRKGLALVVHQDGSLPDHLLGDQDRIRQVLLNLLNNAIKFTRTGEVRLVASSSASEKGRWVLRFAVTDTGIGIPPEALGSLFQRFKQVDGSLHREFGGTGLGLAISKRLVALMGGEIGVESTPGQGSTFWFTVDLAPAGALEADEPAVRAIHQERPARVLLVEDLAINQEIALALLEGWGHQVDVVGDGRAALQAVRERAYDLVLMDVQMPVLDGMAAARLIRALPAPMGHIPIVAMTANVLPHQVAAVRAAGMNDHVGKPFKREELKDIVDRWTKRRAEEVVRESVA
jgi:signal transduction histidine kinase/ActR/RegA family two-component response regulator